MYRKIITIIILIVGVAVFTATAVFAGKNYNSSISNSRTIGQIHADVGDILLSYGVGGMKINQVNDALDAGITEDALRVILGEILGNAGSGATSAAGVQEKVQAVLLEFDKLGIAIKEGSSATSPSNVGVVPPSVAGQQTAEAPAVAKTKEPASAATFTAPVEESTIESVPDSEPGMAPETEPERVTKPEVTIGQQGLEVPGTTFEDLWKWLLSFLSLLLLLALLWAIWGNIKNFLEWLKGILAAICDWATELEKTCSELKCQKEVDQGYKKCDTYQDQGQNACAQLADQGQWVEQWADQGSYKCCTWIPCKWLCKLLVWVIESVLVAVVWVANWVCVAVVWVSNLVCIAWVWISHWVCVVWVWVISKACKVFVLLVQSLTCWAKG